ncbi:MAG: hypothetical protein P0116_01565 [Candidatus Nitrosocosmicus sp.]|nr:hypothetical protein [Candidatus Nitrosocosmicus sp.]
MILEEKGIQEFSTNPVDLFTLVLESPESLKFPKTFKMFLEFIELGGYNSGEQSMSIFSRRNILEAFQGRQRYPGPVK